MSYELCDNGNDNGNLNFNRLLDILKNISDDRRIIQSPLISVILWVVGLFISP